MKTNRKLRSASRFATITPSLVPTTSPRIMPAIAHQGICHPLTDVYPGRGESQGQRGHDETERLRLMLAHAHQQNRKYRDRDPSPYSQQA